MYQPSLFEEDTPTPPDEYREVGEAMRQRLLTCLEHVVCAIEAESDLPEYIDEVGGLGVVYRRSRREYICNGYTYRALKDERAVSSLLLWSVAQFVLILFHESTMHHLKMRALPPRALFQEVADLLRDYTQAGGQIGER